ncbi:MAG: hypothetical protein LUF80_01545 [Oscillospiraceae bacterium]|nr:hypothetical protein [Oscillospiraceae bacterium]
MKALKRIAAALLAAGILAAACAALYAGIPSIRAYVNSLFSWVTELYGAATDALDDVDVTDRGGLIPPEANGSLVESGELDSLEDSQITGEDLEFDTQMYPYYGLLSETEQTFYRQIYANIAAFETTFVPVVSVTAEEMENAVDAVFCDHPEFFWLQTSYSYAYTQDGACVQVTLLFNSTAQNITAAQMALSSAAEPILTYARTLESEYEQEKYVHNAVLLLAEYDESADSALSQSAYSALVTGATVCAGYARAFQYLMLELGIPTYYCVGYATGDHAWNIVKLSDGYYNVDLTWDDGAADPYAYFNLPDALLSQTHTRTGLSLQLPACTATEYYHLEGNSAAQPTQQSEEPVQPSSQTVPDAAAPEETRPSGSVPEIDNSSPGSFIRPRS